MSYEDEFDYGPPLSDDEANEVLVRLEHDDMGNWKWDPNLGHWYYVGPSIAGDGSIDWPDPPSPEKETTP